jgi:hypothetical protein
MRASTRAGGLAAALCLALAGCGSGEPATSNTIATTAGDPLADDPMQQAAEANAQGARANADANARGLDTPNPQAQATDLTTVGPDGRPQGEEEDETPDASTTEASGPARPSTLLRAGSRASFRELEHQLGGISGIAVTPAVEGPSITLGALRSGPAWSTIKVAIALAIEAAAGGHPDRSTDALVDRALTASDNAAAEQLWDQLGEHAGERTQAQLRAAGDTATTVQTQRLRAEFSPFGQTDWSTADQARFAAALPCLPHAERVLTLMGQVEPDQRWGLGSVGIPARFKGGWGPDPAGKYLVRQFGLLTIDGKQVAVAIATKPADGQFATGTHNLNEIAAWAADHINAAALSDTTCPTDHRQR